MKLRSRLEPYVYILPALIIVLAFRTLPILSSFTASFTDYDIGGFHGFIGFDNYARMLNDARFWQNVTNTLFCVIGVVPAGIIIPLFLAILLRGKLAGPSLALVSLMIVSIWKSTGYNTVLFLSAQKRIVASYSRSGIKE